MADEQPDPADEFTRGLLRLIELARSAGIDDETLIEELRKSADALEAGLS